MVDAYLSGVADVVRLGDWVARHAPTILTERRTDPAGSELADGVAVALEHFRSGQWSEETLKLVLERELENHRVPHVAAPAPSFRFFPTCPTLVARQQPRFAAAYR